MVCCPQNFLVGIKVTEKLGKKVPSTYLRKITYKSYLRFYEPMALRRARLEMRLEIRRKMILPRLEKIRL